jgi:hypothetical protein
MAAAHFVPHMLADPDVCPKPYPDVPTRSSVILTLAARSASCAAVVQLTGWPYSVQQGHAVVQLTGWPYSVQQGHGTPRARAAALRCWPTGACKDEVNSPYMSLAPLLNEEMRAEFTSMVHIDGTARLQVRRVVPYRTYCMLVTRCTSMARRGCCKRPECAVLRAGSLLCARARASPSTCTLLCTCTREV